MTQYVNRSNITGINFLLKLCGSVLILTIALLLYPRLFHSLWFIPSTSLLIAVIGVIADRTALPSLGNIPSLLIDFLLNLSIIWSVSSVSPYNEVVMGDVLVLSLCITALEYFIHLFLRRTTA